MKFESRFLGIALPPNFSTLVRVANRLIVDAPFDRNQMGEAASRETFCRTQMNQVLCTQVARLCSAIQSMGS